MQTKQRKPSSSPWLAYFKVWVNVEFLKVRITDHLLQNHINIKNACSRVQEVPCLTIPFLWVLAHINIWGQLPTLPRYKLRRTVGLVNLIFTTVKHQNFQFSEEEPIREVECFAQGHTAGEQPWLTHSGLFNSIKASNSHKPKNREAWSCCQISICCMKQAQYFSKRKKKRREKERDLIFFVAVFQGMLWALLPRMGPQLPIGTITHHIVRGYAEQLAGGYVWPPPTIPMAWSKFIQLQIQATPSEYHSRSLRFFLPLRKPWSLITWGTPTLTLNDSQMDWLQESHPKLNLKYRLLNPFELGDNDSVMKSKSIIAVGKREGRGTLMLKVEWGRPSITQKLEAIEDG